MRAAFEAFKAQQNKLYATQEEHEYRFGVFRSNLLLIEQLNAQGDAVYAPNEFADMDAEEFRRARLLPKGAVAALAAEMADVPEAQLSGQVELPKSFDWRDQTGAVTPVKNQGQCGSCWAFSATENIESVWAIQGKHELVELAPQQIVSCDKVDQGCNGGDTPTAYKYVMSAGGLELESDYPYTSGNSGVTGSCKADKSKNVASISGFEYATRSKNETAMAEYLYTKVPLSICVDASSWQFYHHGVVKTCGRQLDHCVMITGWNVDPSAGPYWIVLNSWGTNWGQQGYIYVEQGKDTCGIATEPTSATV